MAQTTDPQMPRWLTPAVVYQWGVRGLWAAFCMALFMLGWILWSGNILLLAFFPVALIVASVGLFMASRPEWNLPILIVGFGLITDRVDGIQLLEALYGIYYLAFLGLWFLYHVGRGKPLVDTREGVVLLVFILGASASIFLTILFGGSLRNFFSEWIALLFLALFFPVYHYCKDSPQKARRLVFASCLLGLLIVVQNLINYRRLLNSAEAAWEIVKGRVAAGDNELMFASIILLTLLVFAETWRNRTLYLGLFLTFFAGLILTQSRGFWVGFLVGALALFFLLERRYQGRFILIGFIGITGFAGAGLLLFQDIFLLVLGGLFDRLISLATASQTDISLLNRFFESAVVWEYITVNPILGYGMGVPYAFFDIIDDFTISRTFIHNGYLSTWYRFGVWGLGLTLYLWFGAMYRGFKAFHTAGGNPFLRQVALGIGCALFALLLPANTSNPFFPKNTMFVFALLVGLVCGIEASLKKDAARTPSTSSN